MKRGKWDVEGKEMALHEGKEEKGKEGHWGNTRGEMLITLGGRRKERGREGCPLRAGRTIMWREKGKKKKGFNTD